MSHVTRQHTRDDGTVSAATFSTCGTYRYLLTRQWSDAGVLAYVMLNPSKADERDNDPTIARCETRARRLGFGGIAIANLFAFCATDPADLKRAAAPVGPDNLAHLNTAASGARMILAAWGVHGAHKGQDAAVLAALADYDLHVLALTKEGLPRHPLYVSYKTRPIRWTPKA
ncbi:DUF1643 domain-containing protein [Roseobacteraceae bacterium S113]